MQPSPLRQSLRPATSINEALMIKCNGCIRRLERYLIDRIQIPMHEECEVPDNGKRQPAQEESGCEEEEDPAPVEVDERDKDVLEELVLLPVGRPHRVEQPILCHDPVLGGLTREHVEQTGLFPERIEP